MQKLSKTLTQFDYVVICGPTACGKTGLYEELAKDFNIRCINADTGQMYRGVGIGTAKPEVIDDTLFGFDVLEFEQSASAAWFREEFDRIRESIKSLGATPVVVGGSFFYIQALFYEFTKSSNAQTPDLGVGRVEKEALSTEELYKMLLNIDPDRAGKIEKNDRYRIKRALDIFHQTGVLPSQCAPRFVCDDKVLLVYIDPGQEILDQRISLRLDQMLQSGWLDEVRRLDECQRIALAKTRGLIGYKEVLAFLEGRLTLSECRDIIFYQTRNYAKRQRKFFKMLERKIKEDNNAKNLKIVKIDRGEVELLSNCI